MTSPLLIGIPDFDGTHDAILAKYPLTSNDVTGLGGGVLRTWNGSSFDNDTSSTAEFDATDGFTSDGIKHLFWSSNLLQDLGLTDSSWSIIFEVKKSEFFAQDNSGSEFRSPIYWSTNTATSGTDGFLRWFDAVSGYAGFGVADSTRMSPNFDKPSYMADVAGRDDTWLRFCISMKQGKMEMYCNGHKVAKASSSALITANAMTGFWVCSREGNASAHDEGYVGSVRNLMILDRPIIFPVNALNPRVLLVGDSIFEQGNHTNTSVQSPYTAEGDKGNATNVANWYDANVSTRIQNLMLSRNKRVTYVYDVAESGAEIIIDGTNDIRDQTDGTNSPYDLDTINPSTVVVLGGTNDANGLVGALDSAQFETDYKLILDDIIAHPRTESIIVCTIPSQATDSSTTAAEEAGVVAANVVIADVFNEYRAKNAGIKWGYVDLYTLFGGANPDTAKFQDDNLHPDNNGQWWMGYWIENEIKNAWNDNGTTP